MYNSTTCKTKIPYPKVLDVANSEVAFKTEAIDTKLSGTLNLRV